MITELVEIQHLGEINEDENFRFRSWLKMQDPEKIDKIVHSLNQKYSSAIDCTACANCCTVLQPLITKKDIKRIIRALNTSGEEFTKEYIEINMDGDPVLKDMPCRFLVNNKCTLYPYRPYDCRSYPHLHKREFTYRLLGVICNYAVCPIVFNVYEDLKTIMRFHN